MTIDKPNAPTEPPARVYPPTGRHQGPPGVMTTSPVLSV